MTAPALAPVDVVLVNWNSGHDLRRSLASLSSPSRAPVLHTIVVVDNASADGSAEGLPSALGESAPVTVLRNEANVGFAAACNQGAAQGAAEYVLFLNPDVEADQEAVAQAVRFMADPEHAHVGICGIQLTDRAGRVHPSCARFPTPVALAGHTVGLDRVGVVAPHFLTEWDHATTREVDQVMGAFFLIRRAVFESLGGFDERFFVFYEELDLALRARQHGWASAYVATARAYHSAEAAQSASAVRQFYFGRSRILYGHKHFSRPSAVATAVSTLVAEPFARLVLSAARRDLQGFRETVRGSRWLWADARALLAGRDSRHPVR